MVFVDSNLPMYLVGAEHPHKTDTQRVLEACVARGDRLVTDAEVFQEILHRYTALRRTDAIGPAFAALRGLVDDVLPVAERDVMRARDIVLAYVGLSARDAIHLAIMEHGGIHHIATFDRGFDAFPGIHRIPG